MKKNILPIFCLALLLASCSQNQNTSKENEHDIRIYHQAIAFGDIGTAIYSMHSLLARDSANYGWYDTLAMLYFNSNNMPQALQSAQKALKKEPDNTKLMQVMAEGAKRTGRGDIALPYFLKLSEKTKNPEYDYEAAVLHFYGQHYKEAEDAAMKVLNQPASDKYYVQITESNNQVQKVPLKAALLNLMGFIRQKDNKNEEARDYYLKALAVFPDFVLAKNNLDALNKK